MSIIKKMETLFSISPLAIGSVPIVIGVTSAIKQIGLPSQYAPLVSILFGISVLFLTGAIWQVVIAQGIIVGLVSSGLYSGSKALIEG